MTGDGAAVALDDVDRALVGAFQRGFPVVHRPFEPAAQALRSQGVTVSTDDLVARVARLVDAGALARFGVVVDVEELGGARTLAAMQVPGDRFDEVAGAVNEHPEVVESHERDHPRLNLWFVVAACDTGAAADGAAGRVRDVLAGIADETGLEPVAFAEREVFCAASAVSVDGPVRGADVDLSHLGPNPKPSDRDGLTSDEHALVRAVQDGFPVSATPYEDVAADLDRDLDWVLETVRRFNVEGKVRRVGVVPDRAGLGFTADAVTVWTVPDDAVADAGRAVADLSFVSDCVEREPAEDWPYNVYATVRARSRDECEARVRRVREEMAAHWDVAADDWDALFGTRRLKHTGVRLGDRPAAADGE